MENETEKNLEINLNADIAQGIYSNLAIITHSHSDFVLDFVNIMPGLPKADVRSRIILTPQHAKRFAAALLDNVKRYEMSFGQIKEPSQEPPVFNAPKTQA